MQAAALFNSLSRPTVANRLIAWCKSRDERCVSLSALDK
jgi:hypothetical protein